MRFFINQYLLFKKIFAIIVSGINVNNSGFTANKFVYLIEYKHIPTILFILSGRTANKFWC